MVEVRDNSDNKVKLVWSEKQLNKQIVKKLMKRNNFFAQKWYLLL